MGKEICYRCNGSGLIEVGFSKPKRVQCPICGGRGVRCPLRNETGEEGDRWK